MLAMRSSLFFSFKNISKSGELSKCSEIAFLVREVTNEKCFISDIIASSTTHWIAGLLRRGRSSLGADLVHGKKRVPRPAAGITTLVTFILSPCNKLHLELIKKIYFTAPK